MQILGLAVIAILFVIYFGIVTYQQSFAACDYFGCYNYPQEKDTTNIKFLSEHIASTTEVATPSL